MGIFPVSILKICHIKDCYLANSEEPGHLKQSFNIQWCRIFQNQLLRIFQWETPKHSYSCLKVWIYLLDSQWEDNENEETREIVPYYWVSHSSK